MKKALLALLLTAAALPAAAKTKPTTKTAPRELSDLRGGGYALKVSGFLCTACTRAVVEELSRLKEVDEAKADFDKEEVTIKVRADTVLTMLNLRKALKRAAKRVNLGTDFEIKSVVYKPL